MYQGITSDLHKIEHEYIDTIRAEHPEWVERTEPMDPDVIMQRIGVTYLPQDRPSGYLRLYPHDFIVEEVMENGTVSALGRTPVFQDNEDRRTLWADLIKASISGMNAVADINHTLGLTQGALGYSGIKDTVALTSQRVSLRGVTKEQAEALKSDRMVLRPVAYGNGALQPGSLRGNRFTIFVRTDSDAPIDHLLTALGEQGFYNFFGAQRFGPRLHAHLLGQKILQGDADGAVKLFLTSPGVFDVPFFRDTRNRLSELYGDWDEMLALAERFPFTMKDEIIVLKSLQQDPRKTRLALAQIREQTKMWVYAYGSWVINRYISDHVNRGEDIAEFIPLPLSSMGVPAEYRSYMKEDGTENYLSALQGYPFIQPSDKDIPSRMMPFGLKWEHLDQGWVVRFALHKGAYATSCLSHVFRLYEGMPIPAWVKGGEIDSFEIIGDGTIKPWHDRLASVLKRRDEIGRDEAQADPSAT